MEEIRQGARFETDPAIVPGCLAQVQLHSRWRPCAWWLWRSLSAVLDLRLL